ncbi:MAG: TolB family protein [Myxococcota bacterium]
MGVTPPRRPVYMGHLRRLTTTLLTGAMLTGAMLTGVCLSMPQTATASTEFQPLAELKAHRTKNFRILYDPSEGESSAQRIGELCEEIRLEVLGTLKLPDPGFYDVLLIDNYDLANGSATGYPTRILRLYLNGPFPPVSGSSDLSDSMGETWLRELITHEYTHAVHLNYFSGWTVAWKWLFGSTPFSLVYPSWFIEGLAVAVESHTGSRGRARTTFTDMIFRTALHEDQFLPMGAWNDLNGWPRGGVRYLYGGAFLHYIKVRFGADAFKRILDAAHRQLPLIDDLRPGPLAPLLKELGVPPEKADNLRFGGLERAFQRALGQPLSVLVKDWEQQLRQEMLLEVARLQRAGLTSLERLSAEEGSTRSPVLSPDGRMVAYVGGGDDQLRGIYLVPVEGGRSRHIITRDDLQGGLTFSPDGERLVYSRLLSTDAPLSRSLGRGDLYALDLRTGRETRLTHQQRLRDPSFTPDGQSLVAVQLGQGFTKLVKLSADGSEQVEVLAPDRTYQLSQPSVSPDGRRVALSVQVQQEPPGVAQYLIGVVSLDSGALELIPAPGTNREPAWLDDDRLIFSSDRTGVFNLYALDLRAGVTRPVTNVLSGAFQPAVHRNGAGRAPEVVLRSYTSRGFGVYRLAPTSLETLALMDAGPNREVPALDDRLAVQATLPPTPLQAAERLGHVPLNFPPLQAPAHPYRPILGLRFSRYAPVLETDEGVLQDDAWGGLALGGQISFIEPMERHQLSLWGIYGLSSGLPSFSLLYGNQVLGFPISTSLYNTSATVSVREVTPLEGDAYNVLVWERRQGASVALSLPFVQGRFAASLSGSGSGHLYRAFDETTDRLEEGVRTSAGVGLDLSLSTGTSWRSPARGAFLTLRATQSHEAPTSGLPNDRKDLYGEGMLRAPLAAGTFDVGLAWGSRLGGDDPLMAGGFSGTWALPGVSRSEEAAVTGYTLTRAQLRLKQDLARPEWALGQLPTLFLEKIELQALLSGALGADAQLRWQDQGVGAAIGVVAQVFTLRSYFQLQPALWMEHNLLTGEQLYSFGLEGKPSVVLSGLRALTPAFRE